MSMSAAQANRPALAAVLRQLSRCQLQPVVVEERRERQCRRAAVLEQGEADAVGEELVLAVPEAVGDDGAAHRGQVLARGAAHLDAGRQRGGAGIGVGGGVEAEQHAGVELDQAVQVVVAADGHEPLGEQVGEHRVPVAGEGLHPFGGGAASVVVRARCSSAWLNRGVGGRQHRRRRGGRRRRSTGGCRVGLRACAPCARPGARRLTDRARGAAISNCPATARSNAS
jgi:hypothetical protein